MYIIIFSASFANGVTVRYINTSAVNITWIPVTNNDNYIIEGYTVHYSSVAVDTLAETMERSCSGRAFFNHSGESTSYGVIYDLSEEYDGYQFIVLIHTSNGTLGNITDVTPVIGLRSNIISTTTYTQTDSEC